MAPFACALAADLVARVASRASTKECWLVYIFVVPPFDGRNIIIISYLP